MALETRVNVPAYRNAGEERGLQSETKYLLAVPPISSQFLAVRFCNLRTATFSYEL